MRPTITGFLALLACGCCGPSENDARRYLETEGIKVTSLTRKGDSFAFEGRKGNDICEGTVTVRGGLGKRSQNYTGTCKRDTSACKAGAPAECVKIADELYAKDAKVFPTQAAELYRTACGDKDGRACERAAEFEAIGKTWDKVRLYAEKACQYGEAEGCTRLGYLELQGNGAAKNEGKALELFKQGCQKASMRGCRASAGLMIDATPPDLANALPIAEKLCTAKFEDGCVVLAMALYKAKKDYPRVLGYLENGCKDKELKLQGYACNTAGVILAEGMGMKRDRARALPLFEAACEVDDKQGCSNAGLYYKLGLGAGKDPTKSKEYYEKACKLGKAEDCGK